MKKCALKLAAFFAMVFLLLPVFKMEAAAWNYNTDPTITVSGGRITVTWRSGGNYTEANVNVYLNGYSIGGTCVDYGMGNTYTFIPYDYYKKYQEGGEVVAKIEYLTYGADRVTKSYDTLTCSLPALKRLDGPEASMNCNGILDVTLGKDLNGINYTLYKYADGRSSVVNSDVIRDLQPGHYSYDLSKYMKDETSYYIELQGADYSYSAGWPYSQRLYIEYLASPKSGREGNISWTFDPADDSLTIAGEGSIPGYFPNGGLCDYVNKVVIKDGITGIDKIAFVDYTELTEIYIPSSMKTIDPDFIGYTGQAHSETIHIYYDGRKEDWRAFGGAANNFITDVTCTRKIVSFERFGKGTAVPAQYVTAGEKASDPGNVADTNYLLEGWYADAKLTKEFNFAEPVTEDTVIYAKWIQKSIIEDYFKNSPMKVMEGDTVTLTVPELDGTFTYRWFRSKDGSAMRAVSQNSTYSFVASLADNTTQFVLGVYNRYNSAIRTLDNMCFEVTALPKIVITEQPEDTTVVEGDIAVFAVKATGEGLTYQWQYSKDGGKNWANNTVSSAKKATMLLSAKTSFNGRIYHCIVTDANGNTVTSEAASITVKPALGITKQPVDVTVTDGETAKFSVTATGEGLTYQWQYSKDGGKNWANNTVSSAKKATLSLTAKESWSGRIYHCIVTDVNGKTVTSEAASLTVKAAFGITKQPVAVTVTVGETATFTVEAAGEGLTYQWQYSKDGVTWTNSTAASAKTASLSTTTKASFSGRQYRCIVTDATGKTATSEAAKLTVIAAGALAITAQPANTTVAVGETATFTVRATGEGLTYQWQYSKDGINWTNSTAASAKTASLSTTAKASFSGRQYHCVVTDANGKKVTSQAAILTVK